MKKFLAPLALILVPALADAQNTTRQLDRLIEKIIQYAQTAITFLMLLATIFFIWTVITLIRAKDEKTQGDAKKQLKNSIIGLAVMVTVWGLIKFAATTLGIEQGVTTPLPCPPGTTQRFDGDRQVCS